MGCKFSNKERSDEEQTQIVGGVNLNRDIYEEEPQIKNEADFQFKIKDLIGEKKGNINDHYDFLKILGEGF